MNPQLSDEQQQALHEQGDGPVHVVDPGTRKMYVIMNVLQYERVKPFFEDDPLSEGEQKEVLRQAGERAGWNDPEMDVYNALDPRRHSWFR